MGPTAGILKVIVLVLLISACTYSESEKATEKLEAHDIPVNGEELIYNIQVNNVEVTEWLLIAGVDPNTLDANDISALMWASDLGYKRIVELLIKYGADVNYTSQDFFPLLIASKEGHRQIVEILIQNGANVNHYNSDGITALMSAAVGGHDDIIETLLHNGANPLNQTEEGVRAHQFAWEEGHEDIALYIRNYNDR